MTEYIILVGALALVGLGAYRIFGRGVQQTIAREDESIARIDGRPASEGSSQSSATSQSSANSSSSQSSTSSASNATRRNSLVNPPDGTSGSDAEADDKRSPWGIALVIAGAVAILFLGLGRAKQSSSD
jgi:hypothetical protein